MDTEKTTEQDETTTAESGKTTAPEQDKTETSTETEGTGRTFTQADVDRIVAERLAREKQAAQKKADEEQGKFKELYEAEKAAREAEKAARETAERNAQIERAIESKIADKKWGAREPKALAMLVDREKLEVSGDSVNGIESELERIKGAFPGMFHTAGSADGGAGNSVSPDSASAQTARERLRAAYSSR